MHRCGPQTGGVGSGKNLREDILSTPRCHLQASGEPAVVSRAEKARRQALSEGDLKGAAAAEVSLLTAVLEAQFGQAHVEAEQGLIMLQVHTLPARQLMPMFQGNCRARSWDSHGADPGGCL